MMRFLRILLLLFTVIQGVNVYSFDRLVYYLCVGDGLIYEADQTDPDTVNRKYHYDFTGGHITSSDSRVTIVIYNTPGTFRTNLKTTFKDGTDSLDQVSVVVYSSPIPKFYFPKDTGYCAGGNSPITLSTTTSAITGVSYLWNTGATTPSINVNTQGTFYVDLVIRSDSRTCDSVHRSITITENPIPNVYLGQDKLMCQNQTILLDAGAGVGYQYLWTPDNDVTQTKSVNLPGTYKVRVTNQFGCYSEDEILFQDSCPHYVFIPNAVYPNDDRLNDLFIKVLNFTPLEAVFSIYDRWGEMLYESKDLNAAWDCKVDGNTVPQDVYVYKLVYKDTDKKWYEFRGTFFVLR